MKSLIVCSLALLAALCTLNLARADEEGWDFSQTPAQQTPTNCIPMLGGGGRPGEWKVVMDQVPLSAEMQAFGGRTNAPKAVVAQLSTDPTAERFPMLQLGTNIYGDFKFTCRFKLVSGFAEQMAGVAFRIQDEKNYYYIRADALNHNFYFIKVTDGQRSLPIGNEMKFDLDVWHDLGIDCNKTAIQITLDGRKVLPLMNDPSYAKGRIAFWTKSDAVSYFADPRIEFTPMIPFAQTLVDRTFKDHTLLQGLQILQVDPVTRLSHVRASLNREEVGSEGEKTDYDCLHSGKSFFRKDKKNVYVTVPITDRNGESVAVVRIVTKAKFYQSRETSVINSMDLVREMQESVLSVDSLF